MQMPIHYASSGRGIPFCFQHGLGSNLQQPQALLGDLADVQLISMDCPGHGQAPLTEHRIPSFDYYADELVRLMDQLKTKNAILGGISMGAGIALNIALRYPEYVRALVLVRPAWLDEGTPENLAILLEAAQCIGRKDGQVAFEQSAAFRNIKKALPNAARSILGVFAPTQRPEMPLVLEKMVKDRPFSELKALAQVQRPCSVIGNEDDPLHPFSIAEDIHSVIPGSELVKTVSRYLDDAGHRKAVNLVVTKFIQNL